MFCKEKKNMWNNGGTDDDEQTENNCIITVCSSLDQSSAHANQKEYVANNTTQT